MTNLNKTKEEIIFELVLSLNRGDSGFLWSCGKADQRIKAAISQYESFVEEGIIKEIKG